MADFEYFVQKSYRRTLSVSVKPDGSVVEKQTRGFSKIKSKLEALLRSHPVTLVYPVAGKGCGMAEEAALQWKSNPAKYARNMSLMISLDGMDLAEGSHEIGAFVNGECRGSALIQRVEGIDIPLAFLTVCGEEDDVVSFKVYDVKAGKVLESSVKERIVFTADAVFGSLRHPYLLHVSGRDGDVCAVAASVVARAGEHGDELVVAE